MMVAMAAGKIARFEEFMPHPERFVDITRHPQWTRGHVKRADGKLFFQRAFEYFK
jgi:phosphoribosylformylglycinamidine (FGAM) synthase-like amidotransferase family enzyme